MPAHSKSSKVRNQSVNKTHVLPLDKNSSPLLVQQVLPKVAPGGNQVSTRNNQASQLNGGSTNSGDGDDEYD